LLKQLFTKAYIFVNYSTLYQKGCWNWFKGFGEKVDGLGDVGWVRKGDLNI